tara:strand:+ start:2265 stop:2939 length:675 start_codon:yes stop_codon:yes gene_type:complete
MNAIKHLAIIMDGNQRWSVKNNKTKLDGYTQGLKKVEEIISYSIIKKIPILTIYALSHENIKRKSVGLIFQLIENFNKKFLKKITEEKTVKINFIGEKNLLSSRLKEIFTKVENSTKNFKKLQLNIVFNYGTFEELISIYKNINKKKLKNIDEKIIRSNMYLKNLPDPDLLIRTGGYQRLSNFIILNLSYTELFFTDTLWPDLKLTEIDMIINKYKKIKRNYGL